MPGLTRTPCVLLLLGAALSGCVTEPPPPTVVELVNSTSLDVRPNLYTSASATTASGLFVAANLRADFTDRAFPELRSGETATLTLDCDEITSLGVDAPVLFNAAQLVTTTSEDRLFLRQGEDFECGQSVRFLYFTENDAFHVRVEYP